MKCYFGQLVILLCVSSLIRAQVIDDFSSMPKMIIQQAEKRGCGYEVVTSQNSDHVGQFAWQNQHATFLEYYYQKDPAIPGTFKSADGTVVVQAYCTSDAVKALALRIKDASGEILHYQQNTNLPANKWTEIRFPLTDKQPQGHWGGNNDGKLDLPLKLTGYAWVISQRAQASSVMIRKVTWEGTTTPSKTSSTQVAFRSEARSAHLSLVDRFPLRRAHLFDPLWQGQVVYDEQVAMIKEPGAAVADGTLFFAPTKILRVTSSDEKTVYQQGRDFTFDENKPRLILTRNSRIPFINRASLYKKPHEDQAIAARVGDGTQWLMYAEYGFPSIQVKVTYEHMKTWDGYTPTHDQSRLPRTSHRLGEGQPIAICVLGDSISAGANASGKGYSPHMPSYTTLLQSGIEHSTFSEVQLLNLAVPGSTSDSALKAVDRIGKLKPDLYLIAYGMNDVAGRHPKQFAANINTLLQRLAQRDPHAEFILVSSSLANPQWTWSRADMFEPYRQELATICNQRSTGIVLADMTQLWKKLLENKRYYDLTGNGINHPNDMGHRLYAQVLLALLIPNANKP